MVARVVDYLSASARLQQQPATMLYLYHAYRDPMKTQKPPNLPIQATVVFLVFLLHFVFFLTFFFLSIFYARQGGDVCLLSRSGSSPSYLVVCMPNERQVVSRYLANTYV